MGFRRQCCLKWTVENFLKDTGDGSRRYFWTFTTRDEETLADMAQMWKHLAQHLKREYGKLEFIRVVEPHKSGSRYHLHCLFRIRMNVVEVRRLGARLGWGRTHVVRVRGDGLKSYLGKYLTKWAKTPGTKHHKMFSASTKNEAWNRVPMRDILYTENDQTLSDRTMDFFGTKGRQRGMTAVECIYRMKTEDITRAHLEMWKKVASCERAGDYLEAAIWRSAASCRDLEYMKNPAEAWNVEEWEMVE